MFSTPPTRPELLTARPGTSFKVTLQNGRTATLMIEGQSSVVEGWRISTERRNGGRPSTVYGTWDLSGNTRFGALVIVSERSEITAVELA